MSKRVTFTLDADVIKKIKNIQDKMNKDSDDFVSFSKVVNLIISNYLKLM